jgi:RHS repeat-associated protein
VTDSTPELSAVYNDTDTADVATDYKIQVATTSDFASLIWDSGQSTLASSTPQGTRIAGVSYAGTGLASSTTYYWRIKFWDYYEEEGAWSTATSTFSLASQAAPSAPTSLEVNSLTNPTGLSDSTPDFSAIYQDSDYNPTATSYQIVVATADSFAATSTIWDSTKTALASTTPAGMRIADVAYSGDPLLYSTTYYWRIRFWDDSDLVGAWSTTTATFSLANPSGTILQHITFEYDNVGNIIGITDISDTAASKTLVFSYDDLSRLTLASTTAAANSPFRQTYSYSAIGNITDKSDVGTYTYAGTGYANPHAVTEIYNGATTTYAYDYNGNLITEGSNFYTWDFDNRLIESSDGSASSTYAYDHTTQRVSKEIASSTTEYPNKYFNTDGTTDVKHVFAGDDLIATLTTVGATTSAQYIHPDQLGSTNVVSDSSGDSTEVSDYYPFGSSRVSTGAFDEQRKFTGHEYDAGSDLTYMKSRYYDQNSGNFLSQDPVYLAVGGPNLANKMGVSETDNASNDNERAIREFLSDPQIENGYSYARNNPLSIIDPNGNFGVFFEGGVSAGVGLPAGFSGMGTFAGGITVDTSSNNLSSQLGAYTSYGGLIGGVFHSTTLRGFEGIEGGHSQWGISAGPGADIMFTNADTVGELGELENNWSASIGILTVQGSKSNSGTWTLGIGLGKPGLSYSSYPVQTDIKIVKDIK